MKTQLKYEKHFLFHANTGELPLKIRWHSVLFSLMYSLNNTQIWKQR